MTKQASQPADVELYRLAADALYAVSGMVLFSFAQHECDTKNIILRNFIARSAMTLKSVFALWDLSDFQNAWITYRGLVDRMFHLHHIGERDEFSAYDDWSFFEQYKAQNKLKSDSTFSHHVVGGIDPLSAEQKERIKRLEKNKPVWRRPKAEDVAKSMGMEFIYKYGYDFASMHVHPMANDGHEDFYTITKLQPSPVFPSSIVVIANSILISTMILQEALSYSSFRWRGVLWDFLDDVRKLLGNSPSSFQTSFLKLEQLAGTIGLCEPSQG